MQTFLPERVGYIQLIWSGWRHLRIKHIIVTLSEKGNIRGTSCVELAIHQESIPCQKLKKDNYYAIWCFLARLHPARKCFIN